MKAGTKLYCQNCGKDITGVEKTFYGNVICGEECREELSAAVYFRDGPPDPDGTWHCPHCASVNPLGAPRQEARPNCSSCGKPLDPNSAAPPKKGGCLSVVLLPLLFGAGSWWLA